MRNYPLGYLVDLHVHYKHRKRETNTHCDEVCEVAIARGLDAIAFTEHDEQLPVVELNRLQATFPRLVIYSGSEITVDGMDLILFLPDPSIKIIQCPTYKEQTDWVRASGAAGFLAHPFRRNRKPAPDWFHDPLHGAEIRSRNTPVAATEVIRDMTTKMGILSLLNSDAHRARHVGTYYNYWQALPENNEELVRLFRQTAQGCNV